MRFEAVSLILDWPLTADVCFNRRGSSSASTVSSSAARTKWWDHGRRTTGRDGGCGDGASVGRARVRGFLLLFSGPPAFYVLPPTPSFFAPAVETPLHCCPPDHVTFKSERALHRLDRSCRRSAREKGERKSFLYTVTWTTGGEVPGVVAPRAG